MKDSSTLSGDLHVYVEKSSKYAIFRHPLLIYPYQNNWAQKKMGLNTYINNFIFTRLARMSALIKNGDYDQVIDLVEQPFKLQYLIKHAHSMPEAMYWDVVRQLWRMSNGNDRSKCEEWKRIFSFVKGRPPHLSTDQFTSLPYSLNVYRAGDASPIAWLLNKTTAEYIANQYSPPLSLYSGIVERSHVIHYDNNRGNEELVIDPYHIKSITILN